MITALFYILSIHIHIYTQTFRDLKHREEVLTSEFKDLNKELHSISITFRDAEIVEDEAAEHVIQQSVYMKQKTKSIKKMIGKASAAYGRSKAQCASISQSIETTQNDLVELDAQLVAAMVAQPSKSRKGKKNSTSK